MTADRPRLIARLALGGLFASAAVIQRTNRDLFTALVPRALATQQDKVQAAMTAALGGIGITFVIPPLRPLARFASSAILAGSLPLAIAQVLRPAQTDAVGIPRTVTAVRSIVQLGVLALAWWATPKRTRR